MSHTRRARRGSRRNEPATRLSRIRHGGCATRRPLVEARQMVRRGAWRVVALGTWVALAMGDRAQATTAANLCPPTADPCVVSTDVTITTGSELDFGSRALVIHRGRSIDVGPGTMTIR